MIGITLLLSSLLSLSLEYTQKCMENKERSMKSMSELISESLALCNDGLTLLTANVSDCHCQVQLSC